MKAALIAMLLSIMQAALPVPRQTPNSSTQTSADTKKKAETTQTKSLPAPASVETDGNGPSKENSAQQHHNDAEHSVRITELPPVTIPNSRRDWADWGTWAFNLLLFVTSGLQVWLLCKTLIFIRRQSHEMKRQRVTMGSQLKVMSDQFEEMASQTIKLKEYVDYTKIISDTGLESAKSAKASAETAFLSAQALIHAERPWLLIPIENKIYDIQPPVIIERLAGTLGALSSNCTLGVQNYGRSPARVIERKLWMVRIGDASFPPLSAYERDSSVKMDYVVAPGTTVPVSVLLEGGDGKLTPQEKEAIDTEKNFLWLVGYLRYTDTFERRDAPIYETKLCYRWIPSSYLVREPFWLREGSSEYNGTT
jgi:hypothetical protein